MYSFMLRKLGSFDPTGFIQLRLPRELVWWVFDVGGYDSIGCFRKSREGGGTGTIRRLQSTKFPWGCFGASDFTGCSIGSSSKIKDYWIRLNVNDHTSSFSVSLPILPLSSSSSFKWFFFHFFFFFSFFFSERAAAIEMSIACRAT